MAKHGKKGKLQALPLDLSAMANEPIEAVIANTEQAYHAAVDVFDVQSSQTFVSSGRSVAPMGRKISASKNGVKITLVVSPKPLHINDLDVRPGLSNDTTGANRQRVTVSGRKSTVIEAPRGFIWNGSVFMRRKDSRKIDNAKAFLIKAGADPSPARMLGECAEEVSSAAVAVLSEAIDNAGKNSK